jgi:serine/threonine protein kinase/tetratricopeptide (TPR) repeat protein
VAILSAALELRPEERAAYLDTACAGDADLRGRLEGLLQAYEQAGDFLDTPAAGFDPAKSSRISLPLAEKPGDKIGHYKLLQQIGEGGCGVVYMAEQEEPVRRRVALKVIKLGMDTKSVIARFEAERQALALMDHPNIARVFDAGATTTGRPYFVMELVRGIKITEYCDENHLPTQERLNLFVQVCQAIQHAHQKGIIHRDIKPSNILVTVNDGVPVPKVIDFGIAKATQGRLTDQTLFTAFEQFLGTPAYMSPEQAVMTSLDTDTRSDIYSLGVLLYELLTGKTPFEQQELLAGGLDEMRRTIREKEPPKPSTRLSTMAGAELTTTANRRHTDAPKLIHTIRGDLDWIVMKCLAKDRTRRYETANGLARDIERHLRHEPVTARPPSHLYELQRSIRCHWVGFAATAAVMAALIAGIAASTLEAVRARKAEQDQVRLREAAQTAQAKEATQRQRAEAGEQKANTEAAKSQQVARFLEDMLQGVGPSVAIGRDTTILREILDNTAAHVGKDFTNQPEVEVELRAILAESYLSIGFPHQAESVAREGLQRAQALYGEQNLVTARLLVDLGTARYWVEDADQALRFIRRGLAIQEQLLPHDHADIANTLDEFANTLRRFGKPSEAEGPQREALAMKRRLFGSQAPSLVPSLNNLGLILKDLHRLDEAEAAYREALTLEEKDDSGSATRGFASSLVPKATTLSRLGLVIADKGGLTEGEALLRQAVELDRKVLGNESLELSWQLTYLADVLQRQGKLAEAETDLREALNMDRKAWADRPNELDTTVNRLVDLLNRQHRYVEAEQVLDGLLTPAEVSQTNSSHLLQIRGDFYARRGHWQKAAADMSKVVEYQPDDHWNYHQLALLLVASGDLEGYRHQRQKLLTEFSTSTNPVVAARVALACLILPVSGPDLEAAGKLAERVVGTVGADQGYFPWWDRIKALAEYRQGHFGSAVEWAQKSLGETSPGSDTDALCVQTYMVLAMAQFQLKQPGQAGAAFAKGLEIVPRLPILGNDDLGSGWMDWIVAHKLMDEAATLFGGKEKLLKIELTGPLNALAWQLATCPEPKSRNGALAVALARRAVEASDQKDSAILDTLAAAHAEAGNFADAISVQKQALAIETNQDLTAQYAAHRALYESNTPYREIGQDAALLPAVGNLSDALVAQKKYADAEMVWREILTPQIENERSSAGLWQARADFFGRRGLWSEAATAAEKAIELEPTNHENFHILAPLLAQSGDLDGYRNCCAQILSRFSAADPPNVCERMAKDCLFIPCPGIDLTAAANLAASAVARGQGDAYFAFFQFAQGLADYRTGDWSNAVTVLEKVRAEGGVGFRDAEANAVLAMAQQRLGHKEEARAALAKGAEIFAGMAAPESGDLGDVWNDWIIANALFKEAKALIEGQAAPANGQSSSPSASSKPN